MTDQFIPYSCQTIEESDIDAVTAVLRAPFLTQGPEIEAFEAEFAREHEIKSVVAVCNATAALHIACLALDVGPGDVVWTSPNSFVASANCALYCGAQVDFVDIDPGTRNMCLERLAEKLAIAAERGRLPKAVIPVDFAGLPADVEAIAELARTYGVKVIEDASHAVGATVKEHPVGKYADIAVFSFHPVKIITTGEGGVCATNDPVLADKLRLLRSHGITRDCALLERPDEGAWYYEQQILGYNYRITDLQAALGRSQLSRMASLQAAREAQASRYDGLLKDLPVILPPRLPHARSAHHLYAIELRDLEGLPGRREVFHRLRDAGIGVNVHYIPIHLQPFYRNLGFRPGDFPNAEVYYQRTLSLPLFPRLTKVQQDRVVSVLSDALR